METKISSKALSRNPLEFVVKSNNFIRTERPPAKNNESILAKKKQGKFLNNFQERLARKRVNLKARTVFYNMALNKTVSKNYLWIFFFIKKFVEIMKSNNLIQKMGRLKTFHYDIIGDNSFFSLEEEIDKKRRMRNPYAKFIPGFLGKLLSRLKDSLEKCYKVFSMLGSVILSKLIVFQPDHSLLLCWDFFMLFFLVLNILHIPLALSFDLTKAEYLMLLWYLLEDVPVIVFFIDIAINLNTSYYSKGVFISNRRKILENYLKNHLWIDLLTVLPFVIGNQIKNKYLQMLMLFRIIKVRKLLKKMDDFLQLQEETQGIFDFFKLILLVFYLSHFCGCVWHYVAIWEIESGEDRTWLHHDDIFKEGWYNRYIASLYYSVTTMLTVGYGDMIPLNTSERTISIVMMVLSCGVFAYSINSVGNILKDIYKKEEEFKIKMADINSFMKVRNINKNLQMRVKRYVEYMYQEEKTSFSHLEEFCGSLPKTLKEELFVDGFGKMIKGNPLLKLRFSNEFLLALTLKLREMILAPDDFVYRKGDEEDSLYFIVKGDIEMTSESSLSSKESTIVLQKKKKGESFGEMSFFTGHPRETSAKANLVTHIVILSKSDFLQVCRTFPADWEAYFKVRDELLIYKNVSELAIQCPSCGKYDHTVSFCPMLIYRPHRELVILKHIKSQKAFKSQYKRNKNMRKRNSRTIKKEINEAAEEFSYVNDDMIEEYLATLDIFAEGSAYSPSSLNSIHQNINNSKKHSVFKFETIKGHEDTALKRGSAKYLNKTSLTRAQMSEAFFKNIDADEKNEGSMAEKIEDLILISPQDSTNTPVNPNTALKSNQSPKIPNDIKQPNCDQNIMNNEPKKRKSHRGPILIKQKSNKNELEKNNPEKAITNMVKQSRDGSSEAEKEPQNQGPKARQNQGAKDFDENKSSDLRIDKMKEEYQRYMDHNKFINEFERVKIFKNYYPNNNIDKILKKKKYEPKQSLISSKTKKVQDFLNKWGSKSSYQTRKISEAKKSTTREFVKVNLNKTEKQATAFALNIKEIQEEDSKFISSILLVSPKKRSVKQPAPEEKEKFVKFDCETGEKFENNFITKDYEI